MPKQKPTTGNSTETAEDLPAPQDSTVEDNDVAGDDSASGIELVLFDFRGEAFSVPKDRDEWPTTAIIAFSQARLAEGVRDVLGPIQWQTLNRILPKYRDFQTMFVPAFAEAQKQCING